MVDIYGTLGPSCQQQEILEKMFSDGMTGMRLNLSHTSLLRCEEWLENFHQAAKTAGVEPKLLIDLQGPELRVGNIEPCNMPTEAEVYLGRNGISVPQVIFAEMRPGQQILLDDGKLLLEVLEVTVESSSGTEAEDCAGEPHGAGNGAACSARCRVLRGGFLKPRKSIALPGMKISSPTLTESDIANLQEAGKYGVTGVMLPFVRDAKDLKTLRKALQEAGAEHIRIFAKIENQDGVRQLESLLPFTDEIVIARGDLGNAMPLWELPGVQLEIGEKCKKAGIPYMVVTQMLATMEHAPVPTRAEVSDIFYAVIHGASAVMLTGETAAGEYPAEAMNYMCRTVAEADSFLA